MAPGRVAGDDPVQRVDSRAHLADIIDAGTQCAHPREIGNHDEETPAREGARESDQARVVLAGVGEPVNQHQAPARC